VIVACHCDGVTWHCDILLLVIYPYSGVTCISWFNVSYFILELMLIVVEMKIIAAKIEDTPVNVGRRCLGLRKIHRL